MVLVKCEKCKTMVDFKYWFYAKHLPCTHNAISINNLHETPVTEGSS